MVKIGLVTDIHYAVAPSNGTRHYKESLPKTREAAEFFRRGAVDLVVCLGDLVDNPPKGGVEPTLDYARMIDAVLGGSGAERHYVLGNHCVQLVTKGEMLGAVKQKKSYYSFDRGGLHFVILDACFRPDAVSYDKGNFSYQATEIPPAERDWLKKDLAATRLKTLVFCHQRLDEPKTKMFGVRSRAEVRKILAASGKVAGVFMGHAHENDLQTIDGIRYVGLQAMVEGSGLVNAAYSILKVEPDGTLILEGYRQHYEHPLSLAHVPAR